MKQGNILFLIHSLYLKGENEEKILKSLKKLSINYRIVDYKISDYKDYEVYDEEIDLISCFGTISFLKNFPKLIKTNAIIHNYFASDLHRFNLYQHQINRDIMYNKNGIMLPFSEIKLRSFSSFSNLINGDLFIKPNNCLKVCECETIHSQEELEKYIYQLSNFNKINDDELFWLFDKKSIHSEYRTLVWKNEILTCSQYIKLGNLDIEQKNNLLPKIKEDLEPLIRNIELYDNCYIADVLYTESGFKIIEFNCVASSGIYDQCFYTYFKNIHNSLIEKIYMD